MLTVYKIDDEEFPIDKEQVGIRLLFLAGLILALIYTLIPKILY